MSNLISPFKRALLSLNSRLAQARTALQTAIPAPAPHTQPHAQLHTAHAFPSGAKPTPSSFFGQFQVIVAKPSHQDGPVLLSHLDQQFATVMRSMFVPEPARVAAVNYACVNAGKPSIHSLLAAGRVGSGAGGARYFSQQTRLAVPHGFARNLGLSPAGRGFCSYSAASPVVNGPVRMMAQMYAKPLSALTGSKLAHQPSEVVDEKKSTMRRRSTRKNAKVTKKQQHHQVVFSKTSIQAFLNRASQIQQKEQLLNAVADSVVLPTATKSAKITSANAIALAKTAGKDEAKLQELPKLKMSDDCPTNVDMCFLLDASPLWHLDTMVSALHTDSLKEPKVLNSSFCDRLMEVTNLQYQHFSEVSGILTKLVQCPEAHEITLLGYELIVHFKGTSLYDLVQFLRALGIDPKSPHFELEEQFENDEDKDMYFPEASSLLYYQNSSFGSSPCLTEDAWDECASVCSSMMQMDHESSEAFEPESLPVQVSPWQEEAEQKQHLQEQEQVATVDEATEEMVEVKEEEEQVVPEIVAVPEVLLMSIQAEPSPWINTVSPRHVDMPISSSSQANIMELSTQILSPKRPVDVEYFDSVRLFLDGLDVMNNQEGFMKSA